MSGAWLKKARGRKGLSQLELGDLIGRSESWVSKIETNSIRLKDLELAERIADVLGVPLAGVLGLETSPAGSSVVSAVDVHTRVRSTVPQLTDAREWEMWDTMKRRWFLTQAALAALAVTEALRHGPSESVLDAILERDSVDEQTVAGLEQVVLGWRQAYRSASAQTLLGPAHGTLNLLVELAPDAGPRQDRVVSLIGQMSALVGTMLMLDMADFDSARHYLTVSVRAGQQSRDAELTALALGCRAFHATYGEDPKPQEGLRFAEGALVAAEGGIHPRTHAWLQAVTSEMRATAGEDTSCRHALDISAALLERPEQGRPWLGIGAFDAAKLTAYRGGDLSRLGQHAQAQATLTEALHALDPSMRKHRCTAFIDLAESFARSGDVDAACQHAGSALQLIEKTRHADSLKRIDTLYDRIKPIRVPAVRLLGERLIECKAVAT
ncbi:helix-turn-helix domain-containing protein [Amycolatopsis japonica]|uniref:helix-turn-helix domain-containing protein n=1 Tax=Amycolatopsis japonica TaxID=208439 RepID=UPI0036700DF4